MKTFVDDQNRIDIDANGLRILGMLKRFQTGSIDGLLWTAKMIGLQLSGMTEDVANTALSSLLKRGLVETGKDRQWFITFDGRNAYDEEMHARLMVGTSEARFRNEALTGYSDSEPDHRSRLTWAALPSPCEGGRENTVERATIDQCARVARIRCIAARLALEITIAAEMVRTGEIHRCRNCGMDNRFHHHNGADGQQWQTVCVDCRRKQSGRAR